MNNDEIIIKNWESLIEKQILSESFIRKHADTIDWILVCRYQTLSKEFILEFKEKVDWYLIRNYQKMGKEFLDEYDPIEKLHCHYSKWK